VKTQNSLSIDHSPMTKPTLPATPSAEKTASLDKAFAELQSFGWGSSRGALMPIDDAIPAASQCPDSRRDLEARLIRVLQTDAPPPAKDYACRKLSLIGSSDAVPVLAGLLLDKDLGNAARSALELIPGPEAARTLRESLVQLDGVAKVGVINSLGARRDIESLPVLMNLLRDDDPMLATAAAWALGNLGTPSAAKSLQHAPSELPASARLAIADARLSCAERLLNNGQKAEAVALYRSLAEAGQPKHVQLAARRGLLMAARTGIRSVPASD
jgi:HEAT repeat protein